MQGCNYVFVNENCPSTVCGSDSRQAYQVRALVAEKTMADIEGVETLCFAPRFQSRDLKHENIGFGNIGGTL